MKMVYHDEHPDDPMITVFGTYNDWEAQRNWAVDGFDDEAVMIGDPSPFRRDEWCWHVWEDYKQDGNLMLFKLVWGGSL